MILLKETLITYIKKAVEKGTLKEPFTTKDVKKVCPGFADVTYNLFLVHHRKGNPINQLEYFNRNADGKYLLIKEK